MTPDKKQMNYMLSLLVNADNAIDVAPAQNVVLCPSCPV